MDKEILEAINASFGELKSAQTKANEGIVATLNDTNATLKKLFASDQKEAEKADKVPATATVEDAGVLGGITGFQFQGIPIGQALIGGAVAVFATEILDGVMAKWSMTSSPMVRGVVKLASAGVVVKWGGKILGKTGAQAAALLIAFDGIRDILPIDTWMQGVAGKVSGVVTNKGLAQGGRGMKILEQAELVLTSAQKMSIR